MSNLKNISRQFDLSKQPCGWRVRIISKGTVHSKFFADSKYGGKVHAQATALEWRDNKQKELGLPIKEEKKMVNFEQEVFAGAPKDFIFVCEYKETLYVRDVYGSIRLATDKDWDLLESNRSKLSCEEQKVPDGIIIICSDE